MLSGTDYDLSPSEIARQNQITQQIFANYVERRLLGNRNGQQKVPTIADILPRPQTTARPRASPRGFSSSALGLQKFKNRRPFGNLKHRNNNRNQLPIEEDEEETEEPVLKVQRKHKHKQDEDEEEQEQEQEQEEQESLQSVESEQHDQYYKELFNRDPSENEIDSGK